MLGCIHLCLCEIHWWCPSYKTLKSLKYTYILETHDGKTSIFTIREVPLQSFQIALSVFFFLTYIKRLFDGKTEGYIEGFQLLFLKRYFLFCFNKLRMCSSFSSPPFLPWSIGWLINFCSQTSVVWFCHYIAF